MNNNYQGKTVEQVWEAWTVAQRKHFLIDHSEEIFGTSIENKDWTMDLQIQLQDESKKEICPSLVKEALELHIDMGQYKHGGKLENNNKQTTMGARGMIVGHTYKDKKGVSYRYVGEDPKNPERGIFKRGSEDYSKLSFDDFEEIPEEKGFFGFFAKGGRVKEVDFENSNLILYGFGRDVNGNSIIQVGYPNSRAFSFQINNPTYFDHSYRKRGYKVHELEKEDIDKIEREVVNYIKQFGSELQKSKLKVYSGFKKDLAEGDALHQYYDIYANTTTSGFDLYSINGNQEEDIFIGNYPSIEKAKEIAIEKGLESRPMHMRYAKGGTISTDTPLLPEMIADAVALDKYTAKFGIPKTKDEIEKANTTIPKLTKFLVSKAERLYKSNEEFKKQINARGNKGRDHLYAFMNHWSDAYLDGKSEDELPENKYASAIQFYIKTHEQSVTDGEKTNEQVLAEAEDALEQYKKPANNNLDKQFGKYEKNLAILKGLVAHFKAKVDSNVKNNKSKLNTYVSEIASLTSTRKPAIDKFIADNNLSESEVLNIVQGLGTQKLNRLDFVTALVSKTKNASVKKVLSFAKTDKAFKTTKTK